MAAKPTTPAPIVDPTKNVFTTFPPIIAMVIIAVTLVAMAQFPTTQRLAAAMGWLIFVAVLLANGTQAFDNLTGKVNLNGGISGTNAAGTAGPPPTGH